MEIMLIPAAFVFGFAARQIGLPPLVGFLVAGFTLNCLGMKAPQNLSFFADIGVMLLLFSIGLKIRVKKLLVPQIWGTACIHMGITVAVCSLLLYGIGLMGISFFSDLDMTTSLLIAFALSFSSTVFAVKVLEEKGAMQSKHGNIAIGVLIMQDLFAVVFITFSGGTLPSPMALGLVGLVLLKRPIMAILDRCGHGELLVLVACILPITGAWLFNAVGLKPDLGALVMGMLLAEYSRTDELVKAMFGFKNLFLVGFFLSIGMEGLPDLSMAIIALCLLGLLPLKAGLFYTLFTRFDLRARTSLLASVNLANFSEFGLIVGTVGVRQGWISQDWLVILAVALSLSMLAASPIVRVAPLIYGKWHAFLRRFESKRRLPGDDVVDIGVAGVAVFGMGRVGSGVYDNLRLKYGEEVVGFDFDEEMVKMHEEQGRHVVMADAGDPDAWKREMSGLSHTWLAFLTMSHAANVAAAQRISELPLAITLAATARFDDEIPELNQAGVTHVFNIYAEAGSGFSDHVCGLFQNKQT